MFNFNPPPSDFFSPILNRGFDLAALQRDADRVVEMCRSDAALAERVGDAALTKITSARLSRVEEIGASVPSAIRALEEGEAEQRQAIEWVMRASAAVAAGTLDANAAVKHHDEYVAACAAERYWRTAILALRSAVAGPLNRIASVERDDEGRARSAALRDSQSIANVLVRKYDGGAEAAAKFAAEQGRTATTAHRWWPLGDYVATEAIRPLLEAAAEADAKGRTWHDGAESRRDDPPTLDDLMNAFALRRAGLESARSDALQRVQRLA